MKNFKIYILLLSILITLDGCTYKQKSLGADNEIMILASQEDRSDITEVLSIVFNDTLFTPKPELLYKLKYASPGGFSSLKRRSYLVVAAIGDDEKNDGIKLIKMLVGDDRYKTIVAGPDHLIFTRDQFARDQLFMILTAKTKDELIDFLAGKENWIVEEFEKLFRERQSKFFFENARMEELETKYHEKYGWNLKIPWGWLEVKDSTDANFVWLGREMPFQWLTIQWEDGLTIRGQEDAEEYFLSFPEKYYKHIAYNDYKLKIFPSDFKNWTGWKAEGIWESIEDAQGGPFASYIFYDGVSDRTYHINYLIHNPAKDKSLYIRQLDMISKTFETE